MTTRNAAVAQGTVPANTFQTIYKVFPNDVLILKSVLLYMTGAVDTDTFNLLVRSTTGVQVFLQSNVQLRAPGTLSISTWFCMNANDELVLSGTKSIAYWVSGALLPLA